MTQDLSPIPQGTLVQWCLISHTNIGKTTLTRTLLGQDVGDIRDAPHVTESAEGHPLVQTPQGDVLTLWDTPGFGDSVRLYQRLRQHSNPMGWFLTNLWDRWRDKPFWMSQRAMQAARDSADVVLYLVNAAEDPGDAGYLDAEMHLLQWLGKPVVVLLNQLGAAQTPEQQERDMLAWQTALTPYTPMVRHVVALDAFTRSWIHEQRLFQVVQNAIPSDKQAAYQRIIETWQAQNHERFQNSMRAVANMLVEAAQWNEAVAEPGAALSWSTLKNAISTAPTGAENTPEGQAMQRLLRHLQQQDARNTQTLLELHHLDGKVAGHIHQQLREYFTVHQPLDSRQMGLWGALTTGAAGGLGADLAAGGLTMGAGAVLGALAGAITFAGAALGINKLRGQAKHQVHLNNDFLDTVLHTSLLKYLAVAHFGRGRGHYAESEAPAHWAQTLTQQTAPHLDSLHTIWEQLRSQAAMEGANTMQASETATTKLQALLSHIMLETLHQLYPALKQPSLQSD
ncbi:DUF3482 domain-containing protein [Lampropedia puyangensis]|uniref:DUF3482 domain-containing protein n=1 Tax=Lampropedia puyangensis TaxID=1330072 RepID=A0A4S8F828_9BURK|nr:DUF3482 domain-containing protein [Lampropedia puyangensis]THU02815.1 DUF3482 domain-containing protein [Lampropedia puyangensis]